MTHRRRARRRVPAHRRLHRPGLGHAGDRPWCTHARRDASSSSTKVTSITVDGRRCTTVHTVAATDRAATSSARWSSTRPACGAWRSAAWRACASPPIAVEHQYLLSGPIEGYTPVELGQMPTMRDPDHLVYYKPDGPGLLIGGYEPDTIAFGDDGHPVAVPAHSCSTRTSTGSRSSPSWRRSARR